jgi:ribosome biogenesis protein Nip4
MKPLTDFAAQFGAKIALNTDFIVKKDNRYFLLNPNLKKVIRTDFYYAGVYLGKFKNGIFFPSFNLLAMLARVETNRIIVDKKTAWLFICGRDVFRMGIVTVRGSLRKGDYTLVLNEFDECLGFGKVTRRLDDEKAMVVVKNILDVGDFLRREV